MRLLQAQSLSLVLMWSRSAVKKAADAIEAQCQHDEDAMANQDRRVRPRIETAGGPNPRQRELLHLQERIEAKARPVMVNLL